MTKSNKELIESLMFTINEKANSATKMRYDIIDQESIDAFFWKGKYMAFNEIYSLLISIKNRL